MAETAAILSPEKTVLIPDLDAGCSLAASITADQLRAWKAEHPGAVVVSYVNTTAEVKAESDYCCTSGNAQARDRVDPGGHARSSSCPDMFLGLWLEKVTGRKLRIWMGECHVHAGIRPAGHRRAGRRRPRTRSSSSTPSAAARASAMAFGNEQTHILSTEGMVDFAKASPKERFLVATETGILHRLSKEAPEKRFEAVSREGDLPLHEDDHAAEAARLAARLEVRGHRPARDRRARPRSDRPDGCDLLIPGKARPLFVTRLAPSAPAAGSSPP